jgi:hypothetical protein
MATSTIEDIEKKIKQLSRDEQLCLFERLAHQIRGDALNKQKTIEAQLTAMAFDPEIQLEIRKINSEFTGTELDGLVKV